MATSSQIYNINNFTATPSANDYDVVVSFFKKYTNNTYSAQSSASTLYAIAKQSGTSVLDLLQTFQGLDSMKVSLTMAYYLNSLNPTKVVMYGINSILTPSNTIQRNIIQ